MKNILLAVRPKWVEKICHEIGKDENGKPIYEKRIEVRKTAPKETPFKAYIYCTKAKKQNDIIWAGAFGDRGKWNGHIIGEFVCDKVYLIKNQGSMFSVADEEQSVTNEIARQSCLDYYDMVSYLGNKYGYGWHISDLKIYDKPKELSEFRTPCKMGDYPCCGICDYAVHGMDGDLIDCDTSLTRPPQSWCYVEDLKNE